MSINFKEYYEHYWRKRLKTKKCHFASKFLPYFLKKYSNNNAIANQIPSHSLVLDLGCGDGEIGALFFRKKCHVIGMDIAHEALKNARDKNLRVLMHDINRGPLPIHNRSVDVVVCADVLEHLIDPLNVLKEAHRVLKKEGIIIIYVPNFARMSNRIRMLRGDPVDVLHWDKYGDEIEHLHWFTKPKLSFIISEAGFKIIKFIPVGLPFSFLFGLIGFPSLGRSLLLRALKK